MVYLKIYFLTKTKTLCKNMWMAGRFFILSGMEKTIIQDINCLQNTAA